jgi:hypothetical protein
VSDDRDDPEAHQSPRELFGRARWTADYRAAYDEGASRRDRRQARREVRRRLGGQRGAFLRTAGGKPVSVGVPVALVVVGGLAIWFALHPGPSGKKTATTVGPTVAAAPVTTADARTATPLSGAVGGGAPPLASASLPAPASVANSSARLAAPTSTVGTAERAAIDGCSYRWSEGLTVARARVARWLSGPAVTAWRIVPEDVAQWTGWVIPHHVTISCAVAGANSDQGNTSTLQRWQISLIATSTVDGRTTRSTPAYAATLARSGAGRWSVIGLVPL